MKNNPSPQPVITNSDLATMIGMLDNKVTGLDRKFTGLDRKVTGLDRKFTGLDRKVDKLDEKFTKQIDSLAKYQVETRQELKQNIKQSQDEVIAVIQDVVQIAEQKIDNLDKRTTKLEQAVFRVG